MSSGTALDNMGNTNVTSEIISRVRSFIREEKLFAPKTPLLIAVSGGIDSMVALDLLCGMDYPVGVAHCNFKLRGAAADRDQQFVEERAIALDLPFFTVSFDTEKNAAEWSVSIQEAARRLRYDWLDQVCRENGFHFVVTAHQSKDNAETVLYNMVKQTGLRGLHGIPPRRDAIVRPLLCLSRQAIREYARENDIPFREDETNTSVKYSRNFIRHEVLPRLQELNPAVISAIDGLSRKVADAEILMEERLTQIRKRIVHVSAHHAELKYGYVLRHPAGRTILYEILKAYGFNESQAASVYSSLKGQPGAEFHSATHRLLKDRKSIFIMALDAERETIRQFDKIPSKIIFNDYKIQVREAPVEKVNIRESSRYAYLDRDKLQLPLKIRYWKAGDYFYPYGLTKPHSDKPGKKKLSKYFKDERIPAAEKELVPVLFSGEHLVWLVGRRIDHRFRVTENTKTVLKLKVVSKE